MAGTKFASYVPPSRTVNIPSSTGAMPVEVYGIDLDALAVLARDYAKQLAPIYEKAKAGELDEGSAVEVFVGLLDEVPTLANMILYFGLKADDTDPDELAGIASFPAGVKVELVEAIVSMTFLSENGSGKAFEIVSRAFSQAMSRKT